METEGWGRLKPPPTPPAKHTHTHTHTHTHNAVPLESPMVFGSQEWKPQTIGRIVIWGSVLIPINVVEF